MTSSTPAPKACALRPQNATRPSEGCVLFWQLGAGNKPCPAVGRSVSPSLVSGDCTLCSAERGLAALGEVAVVLSRLLWAAACTPTDTQHVCLSRCWQLEDWGWVACESPTFIISEGFLCESWVIGTGGEQHHVSETRVASCTQRTDRQTDRGLLPLGLPMLSLPPASHPAGDGRQTGARRSCRLPHAWGAACGGDFPGFGFFW